MSSRGWFECVFVDGVREDFNRLCTSIEEFGSRADMFLFKAEAIKNDKFILLQIIPKAQVKQIINHYVESDIKEILKEA